MKKILLLAILLLIGFLVYSFLKQDEVLELPENPEAQSFYEEAKPFNLKVSVFSEKAEQITHIEITPDAKHMLVATLPGTVFVYHKVDGEFVRQKEPFFKVETAQPGFPPREAGLTGIILGSDFEQSGDVFFTYSFAQGKKDFKNRVTRVTFNQETNLVSLLTQKPQKITGKNPELIFDANTPGGASHQIQDGVSVVVNNKPHILFTVGEGFQAKRALDPKLEAGKIILIQRDGEPQEGKRPFPDSPKVQAIGIRNAPAMTMNTRTKKIAIVDTGPSENDRFLYGRVVKQDGSNSERLSFNWDGTDESLLKSAVDLHDENKQDMVLYRWNPTETAVNVVFYENEALPSIGEKQSHLLVVLFGQTASPENSPGKKIVLGTLSHGAQDRINFEDFIVRSEEAKGKIANPLGLAIDPQSKAIYFGDIMEGRIYKATLERG